MYKNDTENLMYSVFGDMYPKLKIFNQPLILDLNRSSGTVSCYQLSKIQLYF